MRISHLVTAATIGALALVSQVGGGDKIESSAAGTGAVGSGAVDAADRHAAVGGAAGRELAGQDAAVRERALRIEPTTTLLFDPLGRNDEHARATVFANLDVKWKEGGRPWIIVAGGGGWMERSGSPIAELAPNKESLIWLLYEAGFAVISTGYTIHDQSLDGEGLFHPGDWARDEATGELRLDPARLERHSSELDLVNLIQYLRHVGIEGVPDLDRRPNRGGMYARSASSVTMNFVLLGPERAAAAAQDERFTTSTRLAYGVAEQYLCSFAAFAPSVVTHHHPGENGRRARRIGEATAESIDESSALLYAFRNATTRRAVAATPVHFAGVGTVVHAGPFEYGAMRELFTDFHPPENVLAMREALLAAGREFNDRTHLERSVFTLNPISTRSRETWMRERLEWIKGTLVWLDERETAAAKMAGDDDGAGGDGAAGGKADGESKVASDRDAGACR